MRAVRSSRPHSSVGSPEDHRLQLAGNRSRVCGYLPAPRFGRGRQCTPQAPVANPHVLLESCDAQCAPPGRSTGSRVSSGVSGAFPYSPRLFVRSPRSACRRPAASAAPLRAVAQTHRTRRRRPSSAPIRGAREFAAQTIAPTNRRCPWVAVCCVRTWPQALQAGDQPTDVYSGRFDQQALDRRWLLRMSLLRMKVKG